MSPYEITFGKKPFTLPEYLVGMSTVAAIDDMLSYREVVFAAVQNKLLKAQVKMKQ